MQEYRNIQTRISEAAAGIFLIDYLAERFTYHTRHEWSLLIAEGVLHLNGGQTVPEACLALGDILSFHPRRLPEPPVDLHFTLCHQTDHFFVLSKPPNLPVHPAGRYFEHTLWHELKRQHLCEEPHFINRLDRETSGLLLVARTPLDATACQRLFINGAIKKAYWVLVEGDFSKTFGTPPFYCKGTLLPSPGPVRKKRVLSDPVFSEEALKVESPQEAVTRFTFCRFFPNTGISLIEAQPLTGRLHQIRASCLSLGFPVVGDKIYGVNEHYFLDFLNDALTCEAFTALRLPHQALHSCRLSFIDPWKKIPLSFTAPYPPTWQSVIPDDENLSPFNRNLHGDNEV